MATLGGICSSLEGENVTTQDLRAIMFIFSEVHHSHDTSTVVPYLAFKIQTHHLATHLNVRENLYDFRYAHLESPAA